MSNVIIYDTYNVNVTIENDEVVGVQVVAGFIHDVIAGTNISIDKTDPLNPVISSPDAVVKNSDNQVTSFSLSLPNGNRVSFDGDVLIFESLLTGYRAQTVYIGTDPNDNQRSFSVYEYLSGSGPTVSDLKFRIDSNGIKINLGSDASGDIYHRNASGYLTRRGVLTATSTATLTVNSDTTYQSCLTAQAEALTIANPTGTPFNGQDLIIRVKDNGTARAITFGAQFRAISSALPTTTTISKTLYICALWNAVDSKWDTVNHLEV